MNEAVKDLIAAIAYNQQDKAIAFSKKLLLTDKAQKDRAFRENMLRKFDEKEERFLKIPTNISTFISLENPDETFIPNRYYLSEENQKLVTQIEQLYQASQKLKELRVPYLNSVLISGASGVGKTLFARYLAHRMHLPFIIFNTTQIIDSLMGNTGKNLDRVFCFLQTNPCVFLIDELDAITSFRNDDTSASSETNRIVITIIQNLDSLNNSGLFLATTNRPDVIDPAVKRRFHIQAEMHILTQEEKYQMIIRYLEDIAIPYDEEDIHFFLEANPTITQAQVINLMIQALARSIATDSDFRLQKGA